MSLVKLYRVRCNDLVVFEGRNEVAAQLIYDHLSESGCGDHVVLESTELNWWPVPPEHVTLSKGST